MFLITPCKCVDTEILYTASLAIEAIAGLGLILEDLISSPSTTVLAGKLIGSISSYTPVVN